jgi:hypothetical protein
MCPTIIILLRVFVCCGDVFAEPLPSDDRDTHTHTQTNNEQGDLISLLLFYQITESGPKIKEGI